MPKKYHISIEHTEHFIRIRPGYDRGGGYAQPPKAAVEIQSRGTMNDIPFSALLDEFISQIRFDDPWHDDFRKTGVRKAIMREMRKADPDVTTDLTHLGLEVGSYALTILLNLRNASDDDRDLKVPYEEKSEAQAQGASWDTIRKVWHVRAGTEGDFSRWETPGPKLTAAQKEYKSIITSYAGALNHGGRFEAWGLYVVPPARRKIGLALQQAIKSWKDGEPTPDLAAIARAVAFEDEWLERARESYDDVPLEEALAIFQQQIDGVSAFISSIATWTDKCARDNDLTPLLP